MIKQGCMPLHPIRPAVACLTSGPESDRTLSGQLSRLASEFADRPVLLGELTDVLQLRGYSALLIVLAFPFVTPIPLPGFSTPFGLVIGLLGLRMALGQSPWLPERIRARELPARVLPQLLGAASRVFGRLERWLKPRLLYPEYPVVFQRATGMIIGLCGLLLLLPLPVPFSNAFPAFTILLLAASGLERDGAVFLAGCAQFLICLGFFVTLWLGGSAVWHRVFEP